MIDELAERHDLLCVSDADTIPDIDICDDISHKADCLYNDEGSAKDDSMVQHDLVVEKPDKFLSIADISQKHDSAGVTTDETIVSDDSVDIVRVSTVNRCRKRRRSLQKEGRTCIDFCSISMPIDATDPLYLSMCTVNRLLDSEPTPVVLSELSPYLTRYASCDTIRFKILNYLYSYTNNLCPTQSCHVCPCILHSFASANCFTYTHELLNLVRTLRSMTVVLRQGHEQMSHVNTNSILAMASLVIDYIHGTPISCAQRRFHIYPCSVIKSMTDNFRLACNLTVPEGTLARDIVRLDIQFKRFRDSCSDTPPDQVTAIRDSYFDRIRNLLWTYTNTVSEMMNSQQGFSH